MAKPLMCYAGQPLGGHDKRCMLMGIKLVLTSVTADTATELEVCDQDFTDSDYQESMLKRVFRHKCSADDGETIFSGPPIRCDNGIMTKTNTNCRPIYYIE